MDYCHFNMEKCYFLFILSIFCSHFVNYPSFFQFLLRFFYIPSQFLLFLSMFWRSFIPLQQNQHFYICIFVCFYYLKTCINVICRIICFSVPNTIPCTLSFPHVHAKFHIFLYSPINRSVSCVFPAEKFPGCTVFLTVRCVLTIRIRCEAYCCSFCDRQYAS